MAGKALEVIVLNQPNVKIDKAQFTSNSLDLTQSIKSIRKESKIRYLISTFYYTHLESLIDLSVGVLTLHVHPRAAVPKINITDSRSSTASNSDSKMKPNKFTRKQNLYHHITKDI